MTETLENPGDVIKGQGNLLQQGRLIAKVHYNLVIPQNIHFIINPTGRFFADYTERAGGFILLSPKDADTIALTDYTLELSDKSKKSVHVERRHKKVQHNNNTYISFWAKVI